MTQDCDQEKVKPVELFARSRVSKQVIRESAIKQRFGTYTQGWTPVEFFQA